MVVEPLFYQLIVSLLLFRQTEGSQDVVGFASHDVEKMVNLRLGG